MTTNFSHQIYKYRILWGFGWASLVAVWAYSFVYNEWLWLLFSYVWARVITFLGVQIAQHRYFTHHSFTTTPAKRRFLLWVSVFSGEGSPISWAIHHRHHHKHSDQELDLHSPYTSKLHSMFLWQIKPKSWWLEVKQVRTLPRDLMRDTEIKFVDKHYYSIWSLAIIIAALVSWKFAVFVLLATVGWAMLHSSLVNFISHWKIPGSYRNYDTNDNSYNNKWVARYLGGEGLHNNHHQYPNEYSHATEPGEFDFAAWIIKKWFAST